MIWVTFELYYWNLTDQQVNRPNTSYGESRAGPSVVASSGLSEDSLKKLPCLVLLDEMKAEQEACCSICLQVPI